MFSRTPHHRFAGTFALAILACSASVEAQEGDFAMQIIDAFTITDAGTILTGQLRSGALEVGDTVCVPLTSGELVPRLVKSIELRRELLERVETVGQIFGVLVDLIDRRQVDTEAVLHSNCELADDPPDE